MYISFIFGEDNDGLKYICITKNGKDEYVKNILSKRIINEINNNIDIVNNVTQLNPDAKSWPNTVSNVIKPENK